MHQWATSTGRILCGSEVASDEAAPSRTFASLRPRMVEGGAWVFPVVFARPEVTRYVEGDRVEFDLVTREVLQDQAWLESLPGTPVILGGGPTHQAVIDITDEQLRTATTGAAMSSFYDMIDEDAHVGTILVNDPATIREVRSGRTREVSVAYMVERRPATAEEQAEHGATRVQIRRHSPRNVAVLSSGRATTTVVADQAPQRTGVQHMPPHIAALIVQYGLDTLEDRDKLVPVLQEVHDLRTANAQLAADAAEAEAEADAPTMPTGNDWLALAKLRERLGMGNDELGEYETALVETLKQAGVPVPDGVDVTILRALLAAAMVGMGAETETETEFEEDEDMMAPSEPQPPKVEPQVAADQGDRRNTVRAGIGRAPQRTPNKKTAMDSIVIGG